MTIRSNIEYDTENLKQGIWELFLFSKQLIPLNTEIRNKIPQRLRNKEKMIGKATKTNLFNR